jgi:hypothetical protein
MFRAYNILCSIAADTDDYKRDIDFVVSLGLKGLKFHPEYQDFIVDDYYDAKDIRNMQ